MLWTILNYPQVTLTVLRFANGDPVECPVRGAEYRQWGRLPGATNKSGAILFGAIPPGDYTVHNTSNPVNVDPVIAGMNPQKIHISQEQQGDVQLMFESSAKPSLIIQYLETESGKPVKGGQFTLTRTTSPSETWTEIFTDDSGIAVVPNLEAGSYVLTQTKYLTATSAS